MDNEQLEVLHLLAENEKAVARLYQTFAQKNEEHKVFWNDFVNEELEHAHWVEQLEESVKKGTVKIRKHKFSVEKLQKSISEVDEINDRASNNALSYSDYAEQLETAIGIENGMIEKKFFKAFKTGEDEIVEVLMKLKTATQGHHKRMKEEWKKNRR